MAETKTAASAVVNEARKITLITGEGTAVGTIDSRPVSRAEKTKRGFRAGMWFWIAAVCCAPIPLLHFILVPLNIILGTLSAWSFWTATAVLENADIACPNCRNRPVVEHMAEKWPVKILCASCGHQLRLYDRNQV